MTEVIVLGPVIVLGSTWIPTPILPGGSIGYGKLRTESRRGQIRYFTCLEIRHNRHQHQKIALSFLVAYSCYFAQPTLANPLGQNARFHT